MCLTLLLESRIRISFSHPIQRGPLRLAEVPYMIYSATSRLTVSLACSPHTTYRALGTGRPAADVNGSEVKALAFADAVVAVRVAIPDSGAVGKARRTAEGREAAAHALVERMRIRLPAADSGGRVISRSVDSLLLATDGHLDQELYGETWGVWVLFTHQRDISDMAVLTCDTAVGFVASAGDVRSAEYQVTSALTAEATRQARKAKRTRFMIYSVVY